ncbi:ABC transporter ATP-binding protein [Oricola cellulosilytica]|uniref:ABC transporter ATP-binding protein n=1 Tax=Oricola cellulosilytica TaxID=1429082 RepID=A0A4R0PEC4_9HYPH|nr:ABC transporter ATP-binding protein [Oricola cellulosilytica]TCD15113.1 ABC transporter ATP-binding protein [Oricola cellulosilytica]
MGSLELRNVRKSFGSVDVLRGINLEVADGEFVVFVGPSGCGKSTLLRIIAGLEHATEGSLIIGGRDVSAVPPAKRGIAMVFQTYALYPHLNVRDNMGLGLKQAGMPKADIAARVKTAAAMLSLDALLERRPAELSGGQRQRVAIGRAIVREPDLFLFDEPLSNLDAALRVQTRLEIARLHDEIGTTMVYVTHDQVEAMTLADRIVVLHGGVIQQVGSPMELYNDPANIFVAGFIGSPKMNFIEGSVVGRDGVHTLGVRPEHITLDSEGGDIEGRVTHVEHLGADTNIYLDCAAVGLLVVRGFGEQLVEPGSRQYARFDTERTFAFSADGSRAGV